MGKTLIQDLSGNQTRGCASQLSCTAAVPSCHYCLYSVPHLVGLRNKYFSKRICLWNEYCLVFLLFTTVKIIFIVFIIPNHKNFRVEVLLFYEKLKNRTRSGINSYERWEHVSTVHTWSVCASCCPLDAAARDTSLLIVLWFLWGMWPGSSATKGTDN